LQISDKITVVCLLRIEKTGKLGISVRLNLLANLELELRRRFSKSADKLLFQFPTLGGGSAALAISTDSLDRTAEIKETINTALNSVLGGQNYLDSEVLAFPATSLKTNVENSDLPIPILVFSRVQIPLKELRWWLRSGVLSRINVMIGFGSHNLIFLGRCCSLTDVRVMVSNITQSFRETSKTYTVVGVPPKYCRDKEIELSGPQFPFHTAIKLETVTASFLSEMEVLISKFGHLFKGLRKEDILGFTPGQMDMTVNYKASYISEAFDFVVAVGDLKDVVDTVTWIDFHP